MIHKVDLTWKLNDGIHEAATPLGTYSIVEAYSIEYDAGIYWRCRYCFDEYDESEWEVDSIDQGKADCLKDYQKRFELYSCTLREMVADQLGIEPTDSLFDVLDDYAEQYTSCRMFGAKERTL